MTTPPDALDVALALSRELERHKVPYALGGALAYGIWGIPRATNDVDVNVFVESDELESVFESLRAVGASFSPDRCSAEARERGMFECWTGHIRIDVFTPSIGFAWEAERTRVRRTIEGCEVYFLSAEALAVFKLMFFRSKDLVDLERLIAVQRDHLDTAYVRASMVEMMGEEDERVAAWDALVADHGRHE